MQNMLIALDDALPLGLVILDQYGAIKHMNPPMLQWSGQTLETVLNQDFLSVIPAVNGEAFRSIQAENLEGLAAGHSTNENPDISEISLNAVSPQNRQPRGLICFPLGEQAPGRHHALLFYDPEETELFYRGLVAAIHQLQSTHASQLRLQKKLERANNHLLQSEKLAGIGQLAAGVAHEINNPIGYVFSNLKALAGYMQDMLKIIDAIDDTESINDLRQLKRTLEYDYIRGDIEALIVESEEGIDRVKKIITTLKDFSHIDEDVFRLEDLHRGIDTTLNVANNELKYKAKIIKDYAQLPKVECNASQINQVLLNLLLNAAQSIDNFGTITIRTRHEEPWVRIDIEDTGCGMDKATASRVFDLFFTTKPVGSGTGLGLSLSYSIVQKHHGRIEVFSTPGKGSQFRVWLPIRHIDLLDI
ncbi:ATP-binding protein [Paralcaligenes sp. KSB-10]|uniref:ATP-binding protein n=1 Tax=Paralcaligenes sp. KSB-10 TaxID=2901142 RepID=UPI001E3CABAF|nr:ATP-binding protein [Paralcaligenes sp. KSB-10]UHL65388.1 ATP-binding protein [Paralcaligenes sp. KSB-10]